MKKRFLWPRLGRRGRTVRNLLVCLALLLWLWSAFSYPLPTREMNFRRLEHYFLLPQGELVFREDDLFVDLSEGQAVAGWVPTRSLPTRYGIYPCDLWTCPVGEGPSPVSLADDRVIFLNLPGEAERGELTIRSGQGQQTAWAQVEENGLCDFAFDNPMEADCTSPNSHWGVEGWPYVLRLYDGQGELLLEQEGEIPLFPHRQGQAYFIDGCYEEYCQPG